MTVRSITDIDSSDHDAVGGKAASLGELTDAGLPVPPGFVVTADAYRSFLELAGIKSELRSILDVDPESPSDLEDVAERARALVLDAEVPAELSTELLDAYDDLDGSPSVAVRSSATAEDLPDASFAGQQESYLHVTRKNLVDRIRECWASLFTPRAIYYRDQQGFGHVDVDIAVVVQRMIDADKSGVLFTRHPSTGESQMIVEAAWGLGEAVVSGAVSPDTYVVDRKSGDAIDVTVAEKKVMHTRDPVTGGVVERTVPDDKRSARVLSDEELDRLVALSERIEDHYVSPQDIEWAIADGEVFVLQSRPITTIDSETGPEPAPTEQVTDGSGALETTAQSSETESSDGVLVSGLGASPGTASGVARIVDSVDELDQVGDGDVIVTEMTTPDMVPAMQRAVGIVTDEGGLTSHASIVSRELGVPAVVGAGNATGALEDGQPVTVDGERGTVSEGETEPDTERDPTVQARPTTPIKPMTATEVKVNVSIPEAAERAAATGADGVGLLRLEHVVLSMGATPETIVAERGEDAYVDELIDGIRTVAEEFYPRPVRARTLDAPTDEFRGLDGGDDEPIEHNPMLGYRGIRRSLDSPELFELELRAFRHLYEMGYDNVEIMFPLVNDAEDVRRARHHLDGVGIDHERRTWGVMIETPSSALRVEDLIGVGIDFVSFGTNDLTQYTLAVDRNNEHVAGRFDELHPSVLDLIQSTIETCREHGVDTGICGQAASKPEMVEFLVTDGVSSISANVDAVRDVQREVKRVEQRLLLDSVR